MSANHLRDHLMHDQSVPADVGRAAEEMREVPVIRLAADLADTFKHHTRDCGRREVRVVKLSSQPTATVGWTNEDGSQGTQDGRDMAREVVDSLRAFLTDHGLLVAQP